MSTANGHVANGSSWRPWHRGGEGDGNLADLVANVMSMRRDLFREIFSSKRDVYEECDVPRGPVEAWKLRDLIDEEPIARRVVECMPKECWQSTPAVGESEEADKNTPFDLAWDGLATTLRGEKSWFRQEEGNPVWDLLMRGDIESRKARYGIIVLGLDDVTTAWGMERPVQVGPGVRRKLLWARPLPEYLCPINSYEARHGNPRCGQPLSYNVTFNDPKDTYTGIGIDSTQRQVHWTRCVHLADGRTSSAVFAQPSLRPVLGEVLSAQKIRWGSGEGYWKQVIATTIFKTVPQLGGNVKVDKADVRDQWEQVQNGLQKAMFLMGMEAENLAPNVTDPTPFINVLVEAICVCLGIPVPVFKGYEIGEQASTENRKDWNERIMMRRNTYLTPWVIVPFVDRLIWAGVLPEPRGYKVTWPALESQSPQEKATVFATRMQAWSTYANGNVEQVLPLEEVMTREAGYTGEETRDIMSGLEATQDQLEVDPLNPGSPNLTDTDTNPASVSPPEGLPADEEDPFAADYGAGYNSLTANLPLADVYIDEDGVEHFWDPITNKFCKTGHGGGIDATCGKDDAGNTVPIPSGPPMSEKAKRAQASATRVDGDIQRYAEEHNEPKFAKAVGGLSFKNNEPVDVVVGEGGVVKHGIELKTVVMNKAAKITMKKSAMDRKAKWERDNGATFHTVVLDDTHVKDANGPGQHDLSKRVMYYRRGFGSFRIGTMYKVSSTKELKTLLGTPNDQLPEAARRTK